MSETIEREELRTWLAEGRPVTVVDVRPQREREDWLIPGSRHEDLYDRLKNDGPGAVQDLDLPKDRPVVTVCAAGRTSQIAAEGLDRRGYEAYSLAGGMNAWSLGWNSASVELDTGVVVTQVRRTGKGCLSYIVASNDEAVVIDASVEPRVYIELAAERGLSLVGVVDTHVHADHLSRSRALAGDLDAPLYLPDQERVEYPFHPVRDGDRIAFGDASLDVLHTPGHTWESSCYLLPGEAVFTGDTLFVDSVGRPDLEAGPGESTKRARALRGSLRRLTDLPEEVLVLPGHSSVPVGFDGEIWGARLGDVKASTELLGLDEQAFVDRVTAHAPPAPENHRRIVSLNEAGDLPADVEDLEAGGNRCAVG